MKNNAVGTEDLGPRPAVGAQHLPPTRAAVLTAVQETAPATLAQLEAVTGLHANTLRDHLDALSRAGLVDRRRAEPNGRGRPSWLYETTAAAAEAASPYAGLAATLAGALLRTSPAPAEEAVRAGTEWGHELARHRPATRGTAHRQVTGLLADLGFAPEPAAQPATLRLTRCPLLDAARAHPDVVCGVHLGIVRGALTEYGADAGGTALFPFSEPGACRLELGEDTGA